VSRYLFTETASHVKTPLWLKGCAPGFLESKGNFPWLQLPLQTAPDLLYLGSPSSPLWIRDNTSFRYCLRCLHLLDVQLWVLKDLFPKGQQLLTMPIEKHRPAQATGTQPHLLTAKLSQFKTFKMYLFKICLNFIVYNPRKIEKSTLKTKQVIF